MKRSRIFVRRLRLVPLLVAGISVGLVFSASPGFVVEAAAEPPAPAPATPTVDRWVVPTGADVVRPDLVSASVTARASGQRVEVLSERSATGRTWVLPSGLLEAEASSAPVRFRDKAAGNDGWRDIDTTLVVRSDGSVAPRAVPGTVKLAGAGDSADELVRTTSGQRSLTLGAGVDAPLPTPVLEGSSATYPDVLPDVDVRVEVRPTGFEQLWVAKTRAGLDRLLSEQAGGDRGVDAALSLGEVTAKPQANGGVIFTDDDTNKTVARLNPPMVWDAASAPDGQPLNEAAAAFDVVDQGAVLPPKTGGTGELDLSVVPDQDWLADPARQFPVTIDPTYVTVTSGPIFDAYVKEGTTIDRSGSSYLAAGMGSDGLKHRSFLNFATTPLLGKSILSASLVLWGDASGTCTANGWSAYDSGLASTSTRWTDQPTLGVKYATSTQTKGYSTSCPDGTVSIDMKAQAQAWASGTATTKGMVLKSDNETSYAGYHRFWSSEATANQPVLRYTYNRPPATMAIPTIASTIAYTPAGGTKPILYTADIRPNVSGVVSDPDGNTVRGKFYSQSTEAPGGVMMSYCTNGVQVASGTTTSCEMDTDIASDTSVWIKARAIDPNDLHGSYGKPVELRIATSTPTAPVISCPAPYTANSWTSTAPDADLDCTISAVGTGYSAPSTISYSVDNSKTFTSVAIPQSTSATTAKTTVTLPKAAGGHNIRAYAYSPTGKQSALATYSTGWGAASLLTPAADPQATVTDTLAILAAGPPKGTSALPTAKTQWRVSGADTDTAGWIDVPAGNAVTVTETGGQSRATGSFNTSSVVDVADGSGQIVNGRVPTLLDVRVCLAYSTGSQCTPASTVLKVPHAFGAGYPATVAGPGRVALWTGELQIDDSDADLAIPGGSLSVSRTHSSFAGTPSVQNGVFGPGWTASIDGGDSSAGGAELLDGTTQDGTLAVVDADGSALIFTTPTGKRRINSAIPIGTYLPADANTKHSGVVLVVTGSGAGTVVEVTDERAVLTKYQVTAVPTNAAASFKTVEVRNAATSDKITYSYDSTGRVVAIVAPLPDGVTTCLPGTPSNGCRVLKITYATSTTASASAAGDYIGQVREVRAQVNTDSDRSLATYKYDSTGRLVEAKDVRTNLATTYTWTGSGPGLRLATVTPPGQAGFTFNYNTSDAKLTSVTRPNPDSAGGGTIQLAGYVYNVPVAGTITGLPDMTAEVAKWNQTSAPTWAAAVFGPDKPITTPPAPGSADWSYADLHLTDAEGYTVNTAKYGAGDWQLNAIDYNDDGDIVRAWDERAIRELRDGSLDPGAAAQLANITVYNDDITSAGAVITPAGSLVTDSYGPVHQVASAGSPADGTALLRAHTKRFFDQGAPNGGINPDTGQPYRLLTKTVTTAESAAGHIDSTLSVTLSGYNAVVPGDATGWELGQVTTSTTDMDQSGSITAGDITKVTRYDSRGRTREERQPKSNGADAGTRITTYYTAGTSPVSGCGSKPAYAGLVCQVSPAAQPSGQTLPVSSVTAYTWDSQTATTVDTSDTVTSTLTTGYDSATERPITTNVTVAGLTNSTPVPSMTTTYDPITGNVTGTNSSAGSTAMTYDSWGRQVSYTNAPAGQPADTTITTYNPLGQVTSIVDNNGQTNYTYDGSDAVGQSERRGLTTSIKVQATGGSEYTSTGAYDARGALTLEKLPGRITRQTTIDVAGDQTELLYQGQAVDSQTGALADDQPWIGWTTTANANSQIIREWTPDGAAGYDGDLGATAVASDRNYNYDQAGRLIKVEDRTGNLKGDTNAVPCITRTYGFDVNGNRTNQNSHVAAPDGTCSTTTTGSPVSRTYDSADRPTSGGNDVGTYTYDQLGRQVGIPAADAPNSAAGEISLRYYNSGNIHTLDQDGAATTFSLDGANRRLTQTRSDGGVTTNTLVRHYTDTGDNPTWSVDTTKGATTTTRFSELLNGELGLTLTTTGTSTVGALALASPRGDTAATITLPTGATSPAGTAAAGIDIWTDYTEYGDPRQAVNTTAGGVTGIGYGWLGAKQRASLDSGLILMGARVFNSVTASFSSTDPIYQGNSTAYAYPSDPINSRDVTGLANGCGGNGLSRYTPEYYYRAYFTPACNTHDNCYARNSYTSRYNCDRNFQYDLCYACRRAYWGWAPRSLARCFDRANTYYRAVRWFGRSNYEGKGSRY